MGEEPELDLSQLDDAFKKVLSEDARVRLEGEPLEDLTKVLADVDRVQRRMRLVLRIQNALTLLFSTLILMAVIVPLIYVVFPHYPVWKVVAFTFAGRVFISGSPFGTGITYVAHVSELARRRRRP